MTAQQQYDNFAHCGEYHCAITGPGFLLAAAAMLLRDLNLFDHGFGVPYMIFSPQHSSVKRLSRGTSSGPGADFVQKPKPPAHDTFGSAKSVTE
jgi:hypothetical protein